MVTVHEVLSYAIDSIGQAVRAEPSRGNGVRDTDVKGAALPLLKNLSDLPTNHVATTRKTGHTSLRFC